MRALTFLVILFFATNIFAQNVNDEIIEIQTTEGSIIIQLDGRRAPITVSNFVKLIKAKYFDGTIFHRVIPNFMIQGGGFNQDLIDLEPVSSIPNESGNWGYAVFGNVIEGMSIADKISKKPTGPRGRFSQDVPIENIEIMKIIILD